MEDGNSIRNNDGEETQGPVRAIKRMQLLLRHVSSASSQIYRIKTSGSDEIQVSSQDYTYVHIGDIKMEVNPPQNPELVPQLSRSKDYGYDLDLPELIHHLQWMIKKLHLGQDMFLLGPPGPVRRWLAFRFCSLMKREVEYLPLTGDSTESDLKQRREIRNRTIHYIDQAAVRAALNGRILILDGIEKCERNVLPVLNNLLENREMHLEDGRFLVSPKRYEYLKRLNSKEELEKLRLVPVHPKFQVIALGLPIPKYEGNSLDPPLRSRFQARNIAPLAEETLISLIKTKFATFDISTLTKLVAFSESLNKIQLTDEGALLPRLLTLPSTAVVDIVKSLSLFPQSSTMATLMRVYPFYVKSNEAEKKAIEASLTSVGIAISTKKINKQTLAPSTASSSTPPIQTPGTHTTMQVENQNETFMQISNAVFDDSYLISHINPAQPSKFPSPSTLWNISFLEKNSNKAVEFIVNGGLNLQGNGQSLIDPKKNHPYVETEETRQILVSMLQDHAIDADMCIIGEQGSGKTQIVHKFASILKYQTRTMQMYKDMTSRDLLQRRTTNSAGDTIWQNSPLIDAALAGDLAILDGIHRLAPGTLCVIQQLIHDREVTLCDGTKIVNNKTFQSLIETLVNSESSQGNLESKVQEAQKRLYSNGVRVVHPAFRIISLGNPPDKHKQWLNSEIVSMFHFHLMSSISLSSKFYIVQTLFLPLRNMFDLPSSHYPISKSQQGPILFNLAIPSIQTPKQEDLHKFAKKLASFVTALYDLRNRKIDTDESGNSESDIPAFSLRQLIRTCHKISYFPHDLPKAIENGLLFKFFPLVLKEQVGDVLQSTGVSQSTPVNQDSKHNSRNDLNSNQVHMKSLKIDVTETHVTIGNVQVQRHVPQNPALIPRITFFEIPAHTLLLQDMLKDWLLGEHMLLIGNQGVGKNVLVDRMLELLRLEREYIQLHRDTTVQTLTLSPSISNGVVVWEDSALVRAVTFGRVLVIDEADKAPLEVVCILKGLVEDSEMILADGRRIVSMKSIGTPPGESHLAPNPSLIPIHPNFRMIVLANRPGYPFLGNNFFRECGDCFSVHVVDNPDRESEIRLLQSYGPRVDFEIIDRLVSLFGDLREMVDQGQLAYPYSLRELVNIVKHMEAYPNDSLLQGLDNVFHFDQYDSIIKEHLSSVFQRHGLPIGGYFDFKVKLAPEVPLPEPIASEVWRVSDEHLVPRTSSFGQVHISSISKKGEWKSPTGKKNAEFKLKTPPSGRIKSFSEEKISWFVENQGCLEGLTAGLDGTIYVLTSRPLQLIAYDPQSSFRTYRVIRLSDHLHTYFQKNLTDRGINLQPTIVTTLKTGYILTFIPAFNMILLLDPHDDTIIPYELPTPTNFFSVFGRKAFVTEHVLQNLSKSPKEFSSSSVRLSLIDTLARSEGLVVFPRLRSSEFFWIDFTTHKSGYSVLPIQMQIINMYLLSRTIWLVVGHNNTRILLNFETDDLEKYSVTETSSYQPSDFKLGSLNQYMFFSSNTRSQSFLNHELTHMQITDKSLIQLAQPKTATIFTPQLTVSSVIRPKEDLKTTVHSMYLQKADLLVNLCFQPPPDLSVDALRQMPRLRDADDEARMVLEVIDLPTKKMRTIVIPSAKRERENHIGSVLTTTSSSSSNIISSYVPKVVRVVSIVEMSSGEVVALGDDGRITIWELDPKRVDAQLKQWNRIVGQPPPQNLSNKSKEMRITLEYNNGKRASGSPKFGIFDGKQHRGNSTFAGGQGGGDTSGIGGTGGPSRFDIGSGDIFQVSDQVKQQVDRAALQAARELAKKALAEQLSNIDMAQFDSSRYDAMMGEIRSQIRQLRSILEAAQAKGKERTWLKLKTQGELDDNRLVDGITGEKSVYKARGLQKPMDGSPQEKPKRLRFVMDVSGSMARFNGVDHRLERLLQCTLMIMESLKGFEHKFSYSIVGHSGDSPEIDFVEYGKAPKNKKERLDVLDKMTAHSSHCSSGDYTIKATELAIRNVVKEEGDDYLVIVFSDANLGRYGIRPSSIKDELLRDKRVSAHILFIAAGEDAQRIKTELPLGKAHVVLDTASMPATFKQIFNDAVSNNF